MNKFVKKFTKMSQMIIKLSDETNYVKIHRFVSNLNKIVLKNARLFQS